MADRERRWGDPPNLATPTDPPTPFDRPLKLVERLLYPAARGIWLNGYRSGEVDRG